MVKQNARLFRSFSYLGVKPHDRSILLEMEGVGVTDDVVDAPADAEGIHQKGYREP